MQSHVIFHGQWNPPKESQQRPKPVGTEEPAQAAEITEDHPSADHVGTASSGASTCDNTTSQSEESETIAALLERMASLEMKVCYFEEKLAQVESEKAALLDREFSIENMKDDDVAMLFYTGFPNSQLLYLHYSSLGRTSFCHQLVSKVNFSLKRGISSPKYTINTIPFRPKFNLEATYSCPWT